MLTKKKHNMIGKAAKTSDGCSIAGKRRKSALKEDVPASYVLFDSWFSSPKMFWKLKQIGLDNVSMLKLSRKVYFRYRGRLYSVKDIYERLAASKIKKKNDYLYSCVVQAEYQRHSFPSAAYIN